MCPLDPYTEIDHCTTPLEPSLSRKLQAHHLATLISAYRRFLLNHTIFSKHDLDCFEKTSAQIRAHADSLTGD